MYMCALRDYQHNVLCLRQTNRESGGGKVFQFHTRIFGIFIMFELLGGYMSCGMPRVRDNRLSGARGQSCSTPPVPRRVCVLG